MAESDDKAEAEYVLLDMDDALHGLALVPNTTYTITGLDTLNPVLTIGSHKLVGEYQETVGACFIFSEHDTGNAQEPNKSSKEIKDVCRLERRLKFRRVPVEGDTPQKS